MPPWGLERGVPRVLGAPAGWDPALGPGAPLGHRFWPCSAFFQMQIKSISRFYGRDLSQVPAAYPSLAATPEKHLASIVPLCFNLESRFAWSPLSTFSFFFFFVFESGVFHSLITSPCLFQDHLHKHDLSARGKVQELKSAPLCACV